MVQSTHTLRLHDLVREVAEALDVEKPSELEVEEFSIDFPLEEGKSRSVSAFVDDDEEEPWAIVYSVFGNIADLDAVDLLNRNFSPGYTFIAADEGDALVCASYPLDDLDSETLEAILADVASWADALQEELYPAG